MKQWIISHKLISALFALFLAIGATCAIVLPIALHEHSYAEEWTYDDQGHWHASTCGHEDAIGEKVAHTWNEGVVTTEPGVDADGVKTFTCTVCGMTKTEAIAKHEHTYAKEWSHDETHHWHASTCGHETEIADKAEHGFGEWITDKEATEEEVGAKHRICSGCGYAENAVIEKLLHQHTFAEEWAHDETHHWHALTCGHETEIADKAEHLYTKGICICGVKDPDYVPGPTEGLAYTLNPDQLSYSCTGIGEATDSKIIIAPEYEGLPVTAIDYRAFANRNDLTSVTIPDSVTSIEDWAFSGCEKLAKIVIPDGVTRIGDGAFSACIRLTSITIPSNLTSIGSSPFNNCFRLVEVINNSNLTIGNDYALLIKKGGDSEIVHQDGYLFLTYQEKNYLIGYEGDQTELTLPETYNENEYVIWQYAFYRLQNVTSVTISSNVTSIGNEAFSWCGSLQSIKYNGTKDQWNAIEKDLSWGRGLPDDFVIHCTDGVVSK